MRHLLLFFLVLTISSCNQNDNIMKIGIIAPLTGEGATYGDAMKKGFELAFEDDENYLLVYEDSKLDAKEGVSAINKLISFDNTQVIYGAAASSVTLAIAPIAEKEKRIILSSISTADDIQNSGDFIFRNVPSNYVQGITAADFLMQELGILNIGVLKENDDYGISISKSFIGQLKNNGGNLLVEETYTSTDTDFRTQLQKIKEANVEALFIPGNYEESAMILKQAKELNLNVPIIGGDGSYSDNLIEVAGNAADGFYCTHFAMDKTSGFYNDFFKMFKSKYGDEPNVYEAYAYEAGMILKKSLDTVGNEGTLIKDYLLKNTFESLTGELNFDKNGEVKRTFGVLKVSNGKFTNI